MSLLPHLKYRLEKNNLYKIVFFGDSITSAEWVHPNFREIIEYVLKEHMYKFTNDFKQVSWGIRCINSGLDGAGSKDLLDNLQKHVFDYKPDLVICMATSNDMCFGITSKQHSEYIKDLVTALKNNVPKVVFSNDIGSNSADYNAKYSKYTEEISKLFPINDILYIDMFKEFGAYDLDRFFTFTATYDEPASGTIKDGPEFIHPNQLGNAYIAKILLDKVFNIDFDPEKYIKDTLDGKMMPGF